MKSLRVKIRRPYAIMELTEALDGNDIGRATELFNELQQQVQS